MSPILDPATTFTFQEWGFTFVFYVVCSINKISNKILSLCYVRHLVLVDVGTIEPEVQKYNLISKDWDSFLQHSIYDLPMDTKGKG